MRAVSLARANSEQNLMQSRLQKIPAQILRLPAPCIVQEKIRPATTARLPETQPAPMAQIQIHAPMSHPAFESCLSNSHQQLLIFLSRYPRPETRPRSFFHLYSLALPNVQSPLSCLPLIAAQLSCQRDVTMWMAGVPPLTRT